MGQTRLQSRSERWRVLLAVLCVLLVVVSGTVQVAHNHAGRSTAHADCSLCATAHITVHLAKTPAPVPAGWVIVKVEPRTALVVRSPLSTFALFTRPPPVTVGLA